MDYVKCRRSGFDKGVFKGCAYSRVSGRQLVVSSVYLWMGGPAVPSLCKGQFDHYCQQPDDGFHLNSGIA